MNIDFQNFLMKLGFSKGELKENLSDNIFNYNVGSNYLPSLKYVYAPTESDIFQQHQLLWNKNSEPVFIAITENQSFIINAKEKPDKDRPLKSSICIENFNYGINTIGFEDLEDGLISKDAIDSSFFFDFVSKNQKKNQKTVDKDLFLNLLALKKDLVADGNEEIIHLLILRCLFIKYLEDRGIFNKNYLLSVLESSDKENLKAAFEEVAKINGDVFKFDDFDFAKIKTEYLHQLSLFFKTDYRSGQQYLFPYKFDEIPIQLMSHVYEAFLKGSTKKGKGIYYTPSFLVDFMLSQSFSEKIDKNPKASILDPAVGSGAFLVQAFKIIQKSQGENLSFKAKKRILEEQLFGIDVDANALQIAAFSLYLALLETEDSSFIKSEIEKSNPILPSLIGKTLVQKNALLDDVFPERTFDCIASNPPWGSVPTEQNEEYIRERNAIDNRQGLYPEYENVAAYERSQAFLTRVSKWGKDDTVYSMVVKNSIFLNDKTKDFRDGLLKRYHIDTFYELSHYNKILFKKAVIGEINGEKIEIGASEPCVVLKLRNKTDSSNKINYISPKLTEFSKYFEIIHYSNKDSYNLNQSDLENNDIIWKTLRKSGIEEFELVKKLRTENNSKSVMCSRGFEASKNMKRTSEHNYFRTLVKSEDFDSYHFKRSLEKFDWNQKLHRPRTENLYQGDRILIAYRPKRRDNLRLRCIKLNENSVFRNDILCFKIDEVTNYNPFLGLLNSSLYGFYIYNISAQWDGGLKREALRTTDIKSFDFDKLLDSKNLTEINDLVDEILELNFDEVNFKNQLQKRIDKLLYESYGLTNYEQEIIEELYQTKVARLGKSKEGVRQDDLVRYAEVFKEAFSLILSKDNKLVARYNISPNLGAVLAFTIVSNNQSEELRLDSSLNVLNFVKAKQLTSSDSTKVLFEEKVKIYDQNTFYIIKSNQFKDWTVRQAMKDAKEEIGLFINQLPTINE